jgi:hypothetical protein
MLMSISRRDFFTEAFGKAISHVPRIIPTGLRNLLGIEKDKPLSADEAAFMLAKRGRKQSALSAFINKLSPDNIHSELGDKTENR